MPPTGFAICRRSASIRPTGAMRMLARDFARPVIVTDLTAGLELPPASGSPPRRMCRTAVAEFVAAMGAGLVGDAAARLAGPCRDAHACHACERGVRGGKPRRWGGAGCWGVRETAVDAAMVNGVDPPRGPMGWARAIGLGRVLAVLDSLQTLTGDPRYRASCRWRCAWPSGADPPATPGPDQPGSSASVMTGNAASGVVLPTCPRGFVDPRRPAARNRVLDSSGNYWP